VRTRNFCLVIICLCAVLLIACDIIPSSPSESPGSAANSNNAGRESEHYGPPVHLADLEDRTIKESSGIVASRRNPDLFWTHNDSGDGPNLYAFDRQGKNRGRWRVTGAQAFDWEDIAAGPGPQADVSYLYIGDIGDNYSRRESVTVYRVVEPDIKAQDNSSRANGFHTTEAAEAFRLKYPDGKHDAETLMVHPTTGDLYIITKTFNSESGIYKLKAPFTNSSINTLVRIGRIGTPSLIGGLVTGGDISPDGRRVILCDYFNAYEMVLPDSVTGDFDQIWKQPLATIKLGPRQQGEGVCYRLDGKAILATSEKLPTPLIEVQRK
jgi:hypothetical protein